MTHKYRVGQRVVYKAHKHDIIQKGDVGEIERPDSWTRWSINKRRPYAVNFNGTVLVPAAGDYRALKPKERIEPYTKKSQHQTFISGVRVKKK